MTYPVRGLHYGPTLKVVTHDLQLEEPLPKYTLVLTLEYHDSAGRRHGPAIESKRPKPTGTGTASGTGPAVPVPVTLAEPEARSDHDARTPTPTGVGPTGSTATKVLVDLKAHLRTQATN